MKIILSLLLLVIGLFIYVRMPAAVKARSTLRVNGQAPAPVPAGAAASLAFSFAREDTGQPLREFDLEHEKLMHLVVVSADLASYAHVHPVLDPASGEFRLTVNQPLADPDSQDATRALSKPGPHWLFTEIRPRGLDGIYMHRYAVACAGAAAPASLAVEVESGRPAVKYFRDDSQPGREGDPYQVTLTIGRGGSDAQEVLWFEHHLRYGAPLKPGWQGDVQYKDIRNLELWLSMPGHAILLSQAGASPEEKEFRHVHAGHMHTPGQAGSTSAGSTSSMAGSASSTASPAPGSYPAGPTMLFKIPRPDIPPSGVYKLWAQFKHRGKILTFPFVIRF
jgi:hypothetical protein